tara:strand:- start:1456 stop:2619 length:1164 start_codon:yes stop_codon:yes gene_type:complete
MPINEQTLESFLSGNLSVLDEIVGTDASELKNILNSATISGMQTSEILNKVSTASSASAQRAILNTRLNTYSRIATNTMMKDAPSDTKYVYVGPIDDRTRDECLEYATSGALTEAQIIENGWTASLVDGGGINCRHKWEIASDEGIKLFEGKQAQQVIAGKTPKPFVSKTNVYEGFSASNKATQNYVNNLSDKEWDKVSASFSRYTKENYESINARLRGENYTLTDVVKNYPFTKSIIKELDGDITNIKEFLKSAPKHSGDLYRVLTYYGKNMPTHNQTSLYKQMKDFFTKNKIFTNKQFMSTSSGSFLDGFDQVQGGYVIKLKILNSKSGVNISPVSVFGTSQREILVPDGVRYKIVSTNVKNNVKTGKNKNWNLLEVLEVVLEEI